MAGRQGLPSPEPAANKKMQQGLGKMKVQQRSSTLKILKIGEAQDDTP